MKGFGLRSWDIRMGSFKTQLSILPGQPNYKSQLLGEFRRSCFLCALHPFRRSVSLFVKQRVWVSGWMGGNSEVYLSASKKMACSYTTTSPQYSFIFIHFFIWTIFFFLVIFNYQSSIWYRKTYDKSFPHSYSMSRQWLVYHFRIRDSPLFEGICESELTTLSDLEVCRENSLIPFIHRYLINKKNYQGLQGYKRADIFNLLLSFLTSWLLLKTPLGLISCFPITNSDIGQETPDFELCRSKECEYVCEELRWGLEAKYLGRLDKTDFFLTLDKSYCWGVTSEKLAKKFMILCVTGTVWTMTKELCL